MPELALIVTANDCPRCEFAKQSLKRRGYTVGELSRYMIENRSDRDEIMAAIADNNHALPIWWLGDGKGWRG